MMKPNEPSNEALYQSQTPEQETMLDSLMAEEQAPSPSSDLSGASTQDLEAKLGAAASGLKNAITGAAPGGDSVASKVMLDPDTIKEVSTKLVGKGLLPAPVTTVTPEFIAAVEKLTAQDSAGLYDFTNPDDVRRAVLDVADGNAGGGERNVGVVGAAAEPDDEPGWIPGGGAGE